MASCLANVRAYRVPQLEKEIQPMAKSATVAILAMAVWATGDMNAQSDPSTLQRLFQNNFEYRGAFRVSAASHNGWFSFGGKALAFRTPRAGVENGSLYISSRINNNEVIVAEIAIPALVNSSNVTELNVATVLQPFVDPTENHLADITNDPVNHLPGLSSLLVFEDKLYGTARIYYDGSGYQTRSHYSRALNLAEPSFSGWSTVGQPEMTGYVSGLMALIPPEWQGLLNGFATTGQCCVPVVGRTSLGPAAFAFNPATIAGGSSASATPLLYYTQEHATLGPWEGSNETYGATTLIDGVAIINGTRTALYIGTNGIGPHCYGHGTSDQSLHGQEHPESELWCHDPVYSDKGSHAYPYRYQMWAYDLNDFVRVRQLQENPWGIRPYSVWSFTLPIASSKVKLGGAAYDAERQILYLAQLESSDPAGAALPVIHAFRVVTSSATSTASDAAVSSDKAAPQLVNTPINFTATASGGSTPYQFRWRVFDGANWVYQPWGSAAAFAWTPTNASQQYKIGVDIRSANSTGAVETAAETNFAVSATANTTHVGIESNLASPQPVGASVTFTAGPVGGTGPHRYQWLVHDGWQWNRIGSWSTSNTFVWTPMSSNANYRIGVWVKSDGNTDDSGETTNSIDFPIQ